MSWTEVIIFWLAVGVGVLWLKNLWLRFTVRTLRQWQTRSLVATLQALHDRQRSEEGDDVLDSDVLQ